jgi:hypothetical protein
MSKPDEGMSRKRDKLFSFEDRHLYLHLGYFLAWFSAVELKLTFLLAVLTESRNFDNFELLARGLTPRQKIERLRVLARRGRPFGPNAAGLLTIFEATMIDLRNEISHTHVVCDSTSDTFFFTTISRQPYEAIGGEPQAGRPMPKSTTGVQLFEHGYWLHTFSDDLSDLNERAVRGESLEIDCPKTPMRRASGHDSAPPDQPSSPSKRERKRLRKGQDPRSKKSTQRG